MTEEARIAELVIIPAQNALEVFTSKNGLDPYLDRIIQEAEAFVPDISTKSGRDAIASMAYKVARVKAQIDKVGKDLVDRLKEQPKLVDAERRRVRERLTEVQDRVRLPLTQYEEAEERRISAIKSRMEAIPNIYVSCVRDGSNAQTVRSKIAELESYRGIYDEFQEQADSMIAFQVGLLTGLASKLEQQERDAAELERLRAAQEAQRKKEAEELQKKRAEEARIAEERLREEREAQKVQAAIEQERRLAREREAALVEEAQRARRAAEELAMAQKRAIEAQEEAERQAKLKREAEEREAFLREERNKQRLKELNEKKREAAEDIAAHTENLVAAIAAVELIAGGGVRHVQFLAGAGQ